MSRTGGVNRRTSVPVGRAVSHRSARRAEIVDAAIRAIRRVGPRVTMDDVAAEMGISKPIIYRLFADKTDLYVEVGRRIAEGVVAEVTAELDAEHGPRELVAAVVSAYLRVLEADPHVYRFIVQRSFADRAVNRDPVSDYSDMVAMHLTRLIGERLRTAGLDSGGAEPWAYSIVGMVQSAGDWWVQRGSMTRRDLEDYLTTLLWGGVASLYTAAGVRVDDRPPLRLLRPDAEA